MSGVIWNGPRGFDVQVPKSVRKQINNQMIGKKPKPNKGARKGRKR